MVHLGTKAKVAISSVMITSGAIAMELAKSLRDPSPTVSVSGITAGQAELSGGAVLVTGGLMLAFAIGDYIDRKLKARPKKFGAKTKPRRYDLSQEDTEAGI